jgi:RNA polymerase sigma factor (sigma-70 family)
MRERPGEADMLEPPPSRLLQTLRRLGQATEGADAELLQRFVQQRDEPAFEELLRRHGDLVMRVCRRHLGSSADADDAFQAVFLVLARDAGRIARRESLAGWLYRVAFHVSRKLMGQNARRRTLPVRDADRPAAGEQIDVDRDDERTIVEAEVNALPDRLRSAVVLCYVEGRTTAEAATLLGCPKGTVESRLAAARKRLQARLLKRGVALAAGGALEPLLAPDGGAAAPSLVRRTLAAVMQFARTGSAAGAVTDQVLALVAGVSSMTSYRLTLIAAAAVLLATLGGTGLTVFYAKADGKPPATAEKDKDKEKPKPKADAPPPSPGKDGVQPAADNDAVITMLKQPLGFDKEVEFKFKELIELLHDRFKVPIRIDLAAFSRMGIPDALTLYEKQVSLPVVRGMSLGDALRDALSQLILDNNPKTPLTIRVRNGQILIVPAYQPTFASVGNPPAGGVDAAVQITGEQMLEQEEGEPITLSVEDKPLTEVLRELRQSTGANIVLDTRAKDHAKVPISATLHDVRLMAALRVLGDMCELQPVALNNIFYVTTKENAEKLQKEIDRRRYGPEFPPNALGLGGFGGLGGGLGNPFGAGAPAANPAPAPEQPKQPPAKPKDKSGSGM